MHSFTYLYTAYCLYIVNLYTCVMYIYILLADILYWINSSVSTCNHMLEKAIWDKLPECIFENFEIARVINDGHFKIFKNDKGVFSQKFSETNIWLLVNYTKPTNTLYWNWYLSRVGNYKSASGQLQNSGLLQNNVVNGAISISINRVINSSIEKLKFCLT